jgi:hypothetical protein
MINIRTTNIRYPDRILNICPDAKLDHFILKEKILLCITWSSLAVRISNIWLHYCSLDIESVWILNSSYRLNWLFDNWTRLDIRHDCSLVNHLKIELIVQSELKWTVQSQFQHFLNASLGSYLWCWTSQAGSVKQSQFGPQVPQKSQRIQVDKMAPEQFIAG